MHVLKVSQMNHFTAISQYWDTGVLQPSLPERVVNEKRKTEGKTLEKERDTKGFTTVDSQNCVWGFRHNMNKGKMKGCGE